jgi:hypothetical protein
MDRLIHRQRRKSLRSPRLKTCNKLKLKPQRVPSCASTVPLFPQGCVITRHVVGVGQVPCQCNQALRRGRTSLRLPRLKTSTQQSHTTQKACSAHAHAHPTVSSISSVSLCDMLFVWGGKGGCNTSVLAQEGRQAGAAELHCLAVCPVSLYNSAGIYDILRHDAEQHV